MPFPRVHGKALATGPAHIHVNVNRHIYIYRYEYIFIDMYIQIDLSTCVHFCRVEEKQ